MNGARKVALHCAVWFAAATSFLLPLKFGGLVGLPELPGFYPPRVLDWLVVSWPGTLFPVFSGAALLLVLAGGAYRLPDDGGVRGTLLLWGVLLPLASLPGGINAAVPDYAVSQWLHYAGIGAWCWSVVLLAGADRRHLDRMFAALMWGVFLTVLAAWHQYLWGFEDTRRFFAEAAERGAAVPGSQLQFKLDDNRVYATFSSCNGFAGFLVLAGGAAVCFFTELGGRFEPRRVSRILFGAVFCLLTVGILMLTRSRGALLSAVLAGVAARLLSRLTRCRNQTAIKSAVLTVSGGAWYVRVAGRGFSSGGERLDYLLTSARLTVAHPLAGAGWDGFFREHMRSKTSATDEAAHDPHNFVAAFASQSGIPSGLAALAALLWPLWFIFRRRRELDGIQCAAFWGCAAGALHMLMEVDYLAPANPAAFLLLSMMALMPRRKAPDTPCPGGLRRYATGVAALALALTAVVGGMVFLRGELAYARFCALVEPEPGTRWHPPFPDQVERALAQMEQLRPRSPFALEKAANYYLFAGDRRRAAELYHASLRRSGPRPGPFRRLSEIAEAAGDTASAIRWRRAAAELFPAKYSGSR